MTINRMNSPLFAKGQAKWEAFAATYTGPYDLSRTVYAGMNQKIVFGCPQHGEMSMDAKPFMQGKKCYKCSLEDRKKPRITLRKATTRFLEAHKGRYDYSKVAYAGQNTPVEIICSRHGSFFQQPEFHWNGSGCPQCFHEDRRGAAQRGTIEDLEAKVRARFGDLFDLSGVVYTNSQADISVVCTKHRTECRTRPNWLVSGQNPCPQCNHMKSSGEEEVRRFLSIFTTVEARNRTLIKPREVDMYLPEKKLAVEYCGMYWHSHHDADDERKNRHKHFEKYTQCQEQGVRLLTIYETEWAERGPAIRRLLRNAIGKSRGKLMARKCDLRTVSDAEARAFYEKYHPQGGDGSGEHYALFWKGKMVACMRFVFGANDRGAGASSRSWTLGRYATRVTVAGAASRLFNGFLTDHYHPSVKSFSDNRYFSGGMYEQLGFVLEEEVAPDYRVWSPKIGLRPKSHYQRRLLPKRLQEHGAADSFDPKTDPRTEREMTYLMGCGRVYDCGKKRWVWTR